MTDVPREAVEAQLAAVEAKAADTLWTGSPLLKGLAVYVRAMMASASARDGNRNIEVGEFVVENTAGEFVASFATYLLASFFVEEGSGCYRHRK